MLSQQRILTSELAQHVGHRVVLQGWLHKLRQLGAVNFLVLRDRAGIAQAVLGPDELAALQSIAVESIVAVEGKVIAAAAAPGGYELHDVVIQIINPVTEAPPVAINKKRVNAALPTILSSAVVSYRHPYHRAIFRLGGGVMHGFRRKLHELAFTEIQTPKLVGSATESGANVYSVDHFGQTAYLAQSPQFYKQIMVGVFERVYEVGPVFRAEKHATSRHINEYVSLDAEFGFIEDHFSVMEMVTIVIEAILSHLATCHADDLALLEADMPQAIHSQDGRYFPWIHFQDARALLAEEFGATDTAGAVDLTPEHERLLGQWALNAHGSDFLFVVGYPMRKRPFYTHPDPRDPVHSNSFDLLFRGTELITGGQRLHRYADYLQALEQRGYSPTDFTHYLDAFRYGMPPHGGFAIGLERFVMQLLGLENIRLATLFPRDINRLTP